MKNLKLILSILFFICLIGLSAQTAMQKTSKQAIPAGQPTNVMLPSKPHPAKKEPKKVDMRMKVPAKK